MVESIAGALAWPIAFAALFFLDLCWAIYVDRIKEGDALRGALWAVALFVLSGLSIIGYTANHALLIPSAAGAFCGTYAGVWWNRRGKAVAAS